MSSRFSRSKLLAEYIPKTNEEEKNNKLEIDHEIECPRCHDIMMLSSQFDRLRYLCEECDFHLNLS